VQFLAIAWGFLAPASKFSNRHAKGAGGAGLKNCQISPGHREVPYLRDTLAKNKKYKYKDQEIQRKLQESGLKSA